MTKKKHAISPTREENYPEWYLEVIKSADLAEHSPVRGCMIIKPWGFALWENIQKILDAQFKNFNIQNAYFPLFIPLSFFEKEAEHIEGFAKECAVVTHHRLEKGEGGKLVPAGELEEPLIIRPTSEMMIGESFSKWIESYRDLPFRINQWCNIVRWEMRTRLFLRTSEFLWQEGHTAHTTSEEALHEAQKMLQVYVQFLQSYLSLPVVCGEKSESEKFPGAVSTFTMEVMMQDKKALQAGTAHFLGQTFAKSCGIQFQTEEGTKEFAWTTSWGLTTRLIGALIMVHSDDDGLVLPPKIAPKHVVIIPIIHDESKKSRIFSYVEELSSELKMISYEGEKLKVHVDTRDLRGGEKNWGWIKKGVPIRIEVGLREIEEESFQVARRDLNHREKKVVLRGDLQEALPKMLDEMQGRLLERADTYRRAATAKIHTKQEFMQFFQEDGGFALCHFCEDPEIEEKIKNDLGVTIRCIPSDLSQEEGLCIFTGKKGAKLVLFAKSY